MKRLLLTLALLVSLCGYADAGKFWPVPECPYTGHSTCSDGKDNDGDDTKDEAAPSAAFSAVTGGYAANVAECQLLTYASTSDAESISGNLATKTGDYRTGQIGCTGSFTDATYFLWLRARVDSGTAAKERAVWTNTSAFTNSWQNSRASLLFTSTNGVSSVVAWSKVGAGLNFSTITTSQTPNATPHTSFALNGNGTIYLAADEAVEFDCIFIAVNPDETPICPDETALSIPQAGAITVSNVTTTGFTITWDYDTASADDETAGCTLSIGTTAGNLTPGTPFNTSSGNCVSIETGKTSGQIYFVRGNSSNENGSTNTPQSSVQTSVQTTGPIRFAVASGGSTVANCLSAGTPCTLARALNQGVAGDTIQLADGIYTGTGFDTVRAGTASQPITITAENRHQAIIRATTTGEQCFDIKHSYIHMKWLTIDGQNTKCFDGLRVFGSKGPPEVFLVGVVIEDNRIIDMGGKGLFIGAADGTIVRFNEINRTGLAIYNTSACIYMGSFDGTSQAKNVQVYGNELYDCMTEAIDIKIASNNNQIHHNIISWSGRNGNSGVAAICSPTTGSCDNPNTGAITFDGSSHVYDNIIRLTEARSPWAGCISTFNGSGNALAERNVCRDSTHGASLGGNAAGRGTARSNTFCDMVSYTTNGGGSVWTLTTNNGVPGSGAATSACDAEEARILSERAALPGNPNPPVGTNDPIAYYTFDENTGTDAADSSDGGQTGTLTNGATWATGKNNSGVSLDGINDYVKITTLNWSASTGTITFWYKPSAFPDANTHYIFGHTGGVPCCGSRIQFYYDDVGGNLDMGLGDSHARALNQLDMTAGTWYHLALTWSNGTYVVYVNGAQVSTGSYTGLSAIGGYAHIGGIGDDALPGTVGWAQGAAGVIDEFKAWNIELTDVEVDAEYDIFGP